MNRSSLSLFRDEVEITANFEEILFSEDESPDQTSMCENIFLGMKSDIQIGQEYAFPILSSLPSLVFSY